MKHKIHVWGPKDRPLVPENAFKINTTSTSTDFGRAFSPFMNQGPIEMYGLTAHNVENLWQFTKTYSKHVNDPKSWLAWRDQGLADPTPHRYPMGKGAHPEFSYIKGLGKLSYVEARHKIYIPIYEQKLERYCTRELQTLADILTITDVWLFDFDGRITEQSLEEIFNDPRDKAGHAFVIKKYMEENYERYRSAYSKNQTN
jgi:hypothetical protein